MESMTWVWYQDAIALIQVHDSTTEFCELQILEKNCKKYNGLTSWSFDDRVTIANIHETRPCTEHVIRQVKDNLFLIDDGDEDYVPETDSGEEDEDEDVDYCDEEEC